MFYSSGIKYKSLLTDFGVGGNTCLRWFEGVVCRKMNCQKEYTFLIWAVTTFHNCGLPVKHIIPNWTYRTLCWRVMGQITKFLINPFQRHSLLSVWLLTIMVCARRSRQNSWLFWRLGRIVSVSHWLCQTQALGIEEAISGEPQGWLTGTVCINYY